ncbi:hypothetical protein AWR38_26170 [Idiomarina sp. WRN-38]|uniref:hypothetical protein n=1 Tax=Idiomarina sp. OXR-189 TaxID=3100175 RepID=UPI0007333A1F|nr:hypothetical protein [Idiomarina sp. OXR-189]KTG29791.1 hypothetical protein AUR68_26135 [Idiomarina sp. H105]OAF13182.1 hypothetical protein AWR38_26170 [Idiomarina sp. WRN-38]WPZ00913.1 hypothetical protein UM402_10575 [Idiomarina sp. OXR-189]
MAFDYGSIDLGLKNPFKTEGLVTALRGGIQLVAAVFLLVSAAGSVKEDALTGWVLAIFGVLLLIAGIKVISGGIMAMLRYFVGRNHPTSLARNFSKSERSTSQEEMPYVGYTDRGLEEMLMGRKNATFVEPKGLLARIAHTVFPKLLFMPYPVRNMAQRLLGAWVRTITAMIAFGFAAFVSLAGFAGEAGELAFPVYTVLLTLYLIQVWRKAGTSISRNAEQSIDSMGAGALAKTVVFSLLLPVVVGLVFSWWMSSESVTASEVEVWFSALPSFHAGLYLTGIALGALISTAISVLLLKKRLAKANPVSEVSELRENWQESVHPKEIFINLDNLVMANRRYKEVPNRVYRELNPSLQEQVDGKGAFNGEMIQEIQPKVKDMELGASFGQFRFISLLLGNLLFVGGIIATFLLAYEVTEVAAFLRGIDYQVNTSAELLAFATVAVGAIHVFLIGYLLKAFAHLLANVAHLFFAEIQFESLLIYFKCEGTFTESKISTGTGIHDSTRSENTLVRSSITPWVIVSRLVTTTFAATGMRNLEHPRHILEMHRADAELESIRNDVIDFLKDRESIASLTSKRDLGNASQIHQLNEQTRAIPGSQERLDEKQQTSDEEAAGYLRQEEDLNNDKP